MYDGMGVSIYDCISSVTVIGCVWVDYFGVFGRFLCDCRSYKVRL